MLKSSTLVSCALVVLSVAQVGCKGSSKDKSKAKVAPPVVSGLAAVPPSATVLMGMDVASLRDTVLARRAVERMFARDPGLRGRINAIADPCKIDLSSHIRGVHIAMRSMDESLLVATGDLAHVSLARCVSAAMAASGGTLTTKQIGGRPAFRAKAGSRAVWFARGGPRTLLVSSSEAWLTEALAAAKTPRRLAPLLAKVKQDAPLWVTAEMPPQFAQGLVKNSDGKLEKGPSSLVGELRLKNGIHGHVGFAMASSTDAKILVLLIKGQLGFIAMAAQRLKLGTLVSKVKVDAEANTVYLRVSLDAADVKQLTSRIDSSKAPEQDTQSPNSPRDATPE